MNDQQVVTNTMQIIEKSSCLLIHIFLFINLSILFVSIAQSFSLSDALSMSYYSKNVLATLMSVMDSLSICLSPWLWRSSLLSVCQTALLFVWSGQTRGTADIIREKQNAQDAWIYVDTFYLLCYFDLNWNDFVKSTYGGSRQQTVDKAESD